ncbi:hypothetical protein IPJ91_02345 [bacterium]|nr:MAG: hypothetical protein IPJ91_02345 [bacterium]
MDEILLISYSNILIDMLVQLDPGLEVNSNPEIRSTLNIYSLEKKGLLVVLYILSLLESVSRLVHTKLELKFFVRLSSRNTTYHPTSIMQYICPKSIKLHSFTFFDMIF